MSEEDKKLHFSEDKVDDLIAAHGREPIQEQMDSLEAMISSEQKKQKLLESLQKKSAAKKLAKNQGKGRKI